MREEAAELTVRIITVILWEAKNNWIKCKVFFRHAIASSAKSFSSKFLCTKRNVKRNAKNQQSLSEKMRSEQ